MPGRRCRRHCSRRPQRPQGKEADADRWLPGDGTGNCGRLQRAAAYRIANGESIKLLRRDASPFEMSGQGIRTSGDAIEIIGHAARWMGVPEQGATRRMSDEVFSVRL